jgi:hypothetical protein
MLIHAVNPFGMRNFRRFNENNCDLNRNALTPEELRQAQARDPTSTGYTQLDYLFNPFYAQNKDGSSFSWVDSYGAKSELPAASRSADSERALHQADARNQAQIAASAHQRSFRVECWEMARILGLLLFEMVRTGPALVKCALVGGQYLKSTGVWYVETNLRIRSVPWHRRSETPLSWDSKMVTRGQCAGSIFTLVWASMAPTSSWLVNAL